MSADASNGGYRVTLIPDGVRAVNLQPGDGDRAMAEMLSDGADLWPRAGATA